MSGYPSTTGMLLSEPGDGKLSCCPYCKNSFLLYQNIMRNFFFFFLVIFFHVGYAQTTISLPVWNSSYDRQMVQRNWLVGPVPAKAIIHITENSKDIVLSNGLVKRTFRISPDVACTGYKNRDYDAEITSTLTPLGYTWSVVE